MDERTRLTKNMSVADFYAGYFYASELKRFAREIGITVGNFRKTELEDLIRAYLEADAVPSRSPVPPPQGRRAPRRALAPDTCREL